LIPTSAKDIFLLMLMALGPQFFGHIGMNYALGYIPATIVSVLLLLEPVGAGLIAIPMLGEIPQEQEIWGSIIIIMGLGVVFYPKLMLKNHT
jgi:drug/metabolite transporter (DMT)-like permease